MAMKAYSVDLRAKIRQACDHRFGSQRVIASVFGVSPSCVETRLRRRRMTGDIAPRPHAGGRRARGDEAALGLVRRRVHAHPDATWAARCAHVSTQRGLRGRVPTMSRLAKPLGLPRTKHHAMPASRTPRASSRHVQTTERSWRSAPPSS